MSKRYCLEKLIAYDAKNKIETWKRTGYCDDRIYVLERNFMFNGTRIVDMETGNEVSRKLNISQWLMDNYTR